MPIDETPHTGVLVVEDEYFVADDIARALGRLGVDVVGPVADPATAMQLVEREEIDGAVLDINLKGEMIYPVADALRVRGVPFCFATGYDSVVLPPHYRNVPRWEKPFDSEKLAAEITSMIRRA
jgi:DNA-binding response OmpR family regulator